MVVNTSIVAAVMAMALTSVSATAIPQVAAATVQPDFGLCVPAMLFEDGAFIPMDPLVGQEDSAANPNLITNFICAQLSNVCEANDAAKTLCTSAAAQINAVDVRDQSTADKWNDLLGFGLEAAKTELKKRSVEVPVRRAIIFKACSADSLIDDCTGWPRKRDEPIEIKKREVPFVACSTEEWRDGDSGCTGWPRKREEEAVQAKRAVPFVACSTEEWRDGDLGCTGWPRKREEEAPVKVKRAVEFIPCSTEEWRDGDSGCTGWP